ncbi:hypothetical protein RSA11_13640 [Exiguobacterium indicum]|uniref:site-specific DNA-methyltransferase (adenine-specific) n=1 Tax=Exiguobacterium indicum TaxID=296995 RepID=A0AAW3M8Q5_9BACL|nr:N-6 DNA methylase [Exiguobacterium indicum]KTR25781.1 hypothetical protein RSA11_13640 [Exiguobacterium indicum]
MHKKNFSLEFYETLRGVSSFEQVLLNAGTILTIGKNHPEILSEVAQEQEVKYELLRHIKSLSLKESVKDYLFKEFELFASRASANMLGNVLLVTSKYLKVYSAAELFDEVLEHTKFNKRGIFATPKSVSQLAFSFFNVDPSKEYSFFDGAAGYGFAAAEFVKSHSNAKLKLQEVHLEAVSILTIRSYLNELEADIEMGDLIQQPAFLQDGKLEKFDYVFMSPPIGMKLTEEQQMDMKKDRFNRYIYGIPPRSQGDFAFVSCGLSATKDDGKAAFLLPAGILFRGGPEREIRQRMIDLDLIEAIISLPSVLQPLSGVLVVLVLFNKKKVEERKGKILMINATSFGTEHNRREIILTEERIQCLSDILREGKEIPEVSQFVSSEEIQLAQLTPDKYVYKAVLKDSEFGSISFQMEALEEIDTKPLAKLATFYRGYNASSKDESEKGDFSILKITDVQNGEIQFDQLTRYKITNNAKIERNRIQKGDVLLSIKGVNRKTAYFNSERDDVLLSQNFVGIRCDELLNPKFLQLYMESPVAQFYFDQHITGTTIMNLSVKDVKELPIPILSMEEQLKIVETYEKEQEMIKQQLAKLEKRQLELKIEAFKAMGIDSAFSIQK